LAGIINADLNNRPTYNEQEILPLVAAGDERAFSRIVERYTSVIYAHLLMYLKNPSKAEEATQDIFMSIWRNREKLSGMENFSGYIYVITRNRVYTIIREQVLRTIEPPEDKLESLLSGPETQLQFKELLHTIHNGIEQMPPRRKEVFELSRWKDMTYDQIADQLGISKNSVKLHIKEALAFLRHYLSQKLDVIVPVRAMYLSVTFC
jgi:RNA polymerase sigma-70 factor (family 1)